MSIPIEITYIIYRVQDGDDDIDVRKVKVILKVRDRSF